MCRRVSCETCGKPTFAGCGRHVDQVLGDVPTEARCAGHAAPRAESAGPMRAAGGWLDALFGRGDGARGGGR